MDGVVIVWRHPVALPLLGIAPIAIQTGPEVANAPCRMAEGILEARRVEGGVDPLEVVGGVVTDKDRTALAQAVEPAHEAGHDRFKRCYLLTRDDTHGRVLIGGAALPDHAMEGLP